MLSSKTPISELQEFVVRFNVGSMPKYDLVQVLGPCHVPTFCVKVTVGDESATGSGRTKKEAKHAAAKSMYDQLTRLKPKASGFSQNESPSNCNDTTETNIKTENDFGSPRLTPKPQSETPEPDGDGFAGNPVGELQELCVSKFWPLPVYQLQCEKGLPHRKLFTVSCKVSNIEVIGSGNSKKSGKRSAASKMLVRLRREKHVENNPAIPSKGVYSLEVNHPKESPFPELAMAHAKYEDEREKDKSDQYDAVIQTYKVASENSRLPASYEAYHNVRDAMANLKLDPHRNVNVNLNINISGSLSEPKWKQTTPAYRATVFGGGASAATPKRVQSTVFDGTFSLGNYCSPPAVTSNPKNACGQSSSIQTRSSIVIDHNESDYIEGGYCVYETLEETSRYPNKSDYLEGGGDYVTFKEPEQSMEFGGKYGLSQEFGSEDAEKYSLENPPISHSNTPRSDRVTTNETFALEPSHRTPKNCEERWMYCLSNTYGGEDVDVLKGGKWMIFAKNCFVDEIWSKLRTSVESGDIWQAKVSWLDPKKKSHAIMVFTLDYEDVDDVIRVLDILEKTGVKLQTSEIYYKPNFMTSDGVYGGGKRKPWIYRSSDVRQRRMTGN